MPYDPRGSQFGAGLPFSVAVDLCGPALALSFIKANGGRTPTLAEAKDLAERGGQWRAGVGMLGPQAEVALMRKMGVQATYTPGTDWEQIARRTQAGEQIGLSTPNHYWSITGYDPGTKRYFVGTSGTDMRRGKAWMTADEIADVGGGLHGTITTGVPTEQQRFDEANASRTDARPPAVTSGPSAGVSAPAGAPAAPAGALPKPPEEDPVQKILAEQEKARKRANAALYAQRIASYGPDQTPNVFRLPEPEAPTLRVPSFRLPSLAEMVG
jgi:hypothetical protein